MADGDKRLTLRVRSEAWPIRGKFTISRGSKAEAVVVVAELIARGPDGAEIAGRGECVPYARYGETVESVAEEIGLLAPRIASGLDRLGLQQVLRPGAARNALDCAFWDLEAKQSGHRVWELAGLTAPGPLVTAYTLSLDSPAAMGRAAADNAHRPLLKLKLAGPDDLARVEAVRANAPTSRLIVDANEGWSTADYGELAPRLAVLGVDMIEQPMPAGQDAVLATVQRPVPVCADESCHDTDSLAQISGCYDSINIKLDKTGGLTEALKLKETAITQGYEIMVGCMMSTSLAMAPATLVAQGAQVVDLDAPLLLAKDRDGGLVFEGSTVQPPEAALWG